MATEAEKQGFFAALGQLSNQIKTARYTNAVNQFGQRQAEIRDSLETEATKRTQQQTLADEAFTNAISFGQDAQTAALIASKFQPKTFGSLDAALLSGDPFSQKMAQDILAEQQAKKEAMDVKNFDQQLQILGKQQAFSASQLEKELAQRNAEARMRVGGGKPLIAQQENMLSDADTDLENINSLIADLSADTARYEKALGPIDQYKPDWYLGTDLAETRARVMDRFQAIRQARSGSAFGIQENKDYKNSLPNESDSVPLLISKLQRRAAAIQKARSDKLKVWKKNGRDVDAFINEDFTQNFTPDNKSGDGSNPKRDMLMKYLK